MGRLFRVLLVPHWVYILPLLHLAGCILTAITDSAWFPVAASELPVGILLTAVAWALRSSAILVRCFRNPMVVLVEPDVFQFSIEMKQAHDLSR